MYNGEETLLLPKSEPNFLQSTPKPLFSPNSLNWTQNVYKKSTILQQDFLCNNSGFKTQRSLANIVADPNLLNIPQITPVDEHSAECLKIGGLAVEAGGF